MHKIVVVAALMMSACKDSGPPRPQPSTIAAVAGQDQIGPAGSLLPESLAVLVTDGGGAPVPGIAVQWAAEAGSVSPATTSTNAAGIAQSARTLGTRAGLQQTAATVQGLPAVLFDAFAQIQGATQMGDRSIGPLTDSVLGTLTEIEQPLIVLVLDQNGVPVPGVIVEWEASGGGSVAAPTGVTNAGGESIMEYTFGSEARTGYGARASVSGLIGSPVTWTLTAHPGNPVGLQKTNGDGLIVQTGGQVVHTVTAVDSYGNGVSGVKIEWSAATGGGSITPAQSFTATGGHAEATRTLGTGTGKQTATATAPTLPSAPLITFTTTAAAAVVRVANTVFLPNAVTIPQGDSVAWQWQGTTLPHTITFANVPGAPDDEPERTSGAVWRKFETTGTFTYQCTIHPGMAGSVTVQP